MKNLIMTKEQERSLKRLAESTVVGVPIKYALEEIKELRIKLDIIKITVPKIVNGDCTYEEMVAFINTVGAKLRL